MKYVQNRNARFTQRALHWLIPLLIGIATALTSDAQTLHALLVIMDADPDVGSATQVNAHDVQRFLIQVEKDTGLQVETETLLSSQNHARKMELMAWLNTREIADEDVLFVYFSGKGRDEHVYLQDGGISGAALGETVQNTGNGRLKLLITDRCDTLLKHADENHQHANATPAGLEDLFRQHEGFLHLTSATGQEPGWADANGGFFTHALFHAIRNGTEPDRSQFASWRDIFHETRQQVNAAFKSAYPTLPDAVKADLQNRGIQNQTPRVYGLPMRIGTPAPENTAELWTLKNPDANFTVDFKTDKKVYLIDELITFNVEVTDSAYIFILNWDTGGNFNLLFPNKYEADNFLGPDKSLTLPPKGGRYEFFAMPPPGTEHIKTLALRNAADSNAIKQMLGGIPDGYRVLQQHDKPQYQAQIVHYLQRMKPSDWAEYRTTTEVKAPPPLEEGDFREPDDARGAHEGKPPEEDSRRVPDDDDEVGSHRHPNPVNIVFFKEGENGGHAYLAQLKEPYNQDAAEVEVHIFNETLREKYGEKLPQAWIVRERTEPEAGWGNRCLMLSFYRDEAWVFTTDVMVHEDHYRLPKRLNGNGDWIQGDREVGFGDVRIPIPVAFKQGTIDTEK